MLKRFSYLCLMEFVVTNEIICDNLIKKIENIPDTINMISFNVHEFGNYAIASIEKIIKLLSRYNLTYSITFNNILDFDFFMNNISVNTHFNQIRISLCDDNNNNLINDVLTKITTINLTKENIVFILKLNNKNYKLLSGIHMLMSTHKIYLNILPVLSGKNSLNKKQFNYCSEIVSNLKKSYNTSIFPDFPDAGIKFCNLQSFCPNTIISLIFDFNSNILYCPFYKKILISKKNIKNISVDHIFKMKQKYLLTKHKKCISCHNFNMCGFGCLINKKYCCNDFC